MSRFRFWALLGTTSGTTLAMALTPDAAPLNLGLMLRLGMAAGICGLVVAVILCAVDAHDAHKADTTARQIARIFADREEVKRRLR